MLCFRPVSSSSADSCLFPPPSASATQKRVNAFFFSSKNPVFVANPLSVRLLVPGTSTGTTKLLGLAAAVVSDQQGAVELDEGLLQQVLGVLVDELLVVGDEGLGNGLTDGVDLGGVTTTGDADADVDVGELVEADNQERLVDLRDAEKS